MVRFKIPAAARAIVEEQKKHSRKALTDAVVHDALDFAEGLLNSTYFNGEFLQIAHFLS